MDSLQSFATKDVFAMKLIYVVLKRILNFLVEILD
jgi:hypothetical protein